MEVEKLQAQRRNEKLKQEKEMGEGQEGIKMEKEREIKLKRE